MIHRLFWGALTLIGYAYVGFPIIVLLRGALRSRPPQRAAITPSATVLIAARNEVDAIGARIENLLACEYPKSLLEIIVVSDGSQDGTNDVVQRYEGHGVRLLALGRVGKAQALNAAAAEATGEILVFTDANTAFAPDAIRRLMMPFADATVGGVAGDQRYVGETGSAVVAGERGYWDVDRLLKAAESRAGSTISATGAIYAVRRELFEPIPDGVTDDFYCSTGVIARGLRLVFEPSAVAYEPTAATGEAEFSRKVRVITRGLRGVQARRALLDFRRSGFYSLQLLSHKVLRRLMAIPLLVLALTSFLLRGKNAYHRLFASSQVAFYGAAAVGLLRPTSGGLGRLFGIPAYFCMVNAASLRAVANVLRGKRIDRWEPQR